MDREYVCKGDHGVRLTADDVSQVISICERRYLETKDPVNVWIAIAFCPYIEMLLPWWVQEYLMKVSFDVIECTKATDFGKALGITGRSIQNMETKNKQYTLSLRIKNHLDDGVSRGNAIRKVMDEYGASDKSVEAAMAEYGVKLKKSK